MTLTRCVFPAMALAAALALAGCGGGGGGGEPDSDGDGVVDSLDAFPRDATETTDSDGDGVGDNSDAFPNDATETVDTDGDGAGDNGDLDDDADGALDVIDEHPLDATRSITANLFRPADDFAAFCADPRSGTDSRGFAYPDREGTVVHENNWLRSWSNDTYLWYEEIADVDPIEEDHPLDYFDLMRSFATTPSGAPKDRFHFTYDTEEYRQLRDSGISVAYGAQWAILAARPPREIAIAYTEPNSPATDAGLTRGARIIEIDGASVLDGDPAILNAGLFPDEPGETHEFVVRDLGADTDRTITLSAQEIAADPVQHVTVLSSAAGNVGYFAFNDHNRVAENELVAAVERLKAANVRDLVLDLRYNGGGFLYIAAQVGYMVAGPESEGRVFDELRYNDKQPRREPFPFLSMHTVTDELLPSLDLERVVILSGSRTCSASESIINGLRGIDIEVVLIGDITCGKPYGFLPADNCGTTYFTIQFGSVNEKGFGDYADGFIPVEGGGAEPWEVPGCLVEDDFDHLLGDPGEARLAAALGYIESGGACPEPTSSATGAGDLVAPMTPMSIVRDNRWYDGYREAAEREARIRRSRDSN